TRGERTKSGELGVLRTNVRSRHKEVLAVHRADDVSRNSASRVVELLAVRCRRKAELVRTTRAAADSQHQRASRSAARLHATEAAVSHRRVQLDIRIDVNARAVGCSTGTGATSGPNDPEIALVLGGWTSPVVVRCNASAAASGPDACIDPAIQVDRSLT